MEAENRSANMNPDVDARTETLSKQAYSDENSNCKTLVALTKARIGLL